MHWLAVAVGGALGSVTRYACSVWFFDISSQKFPYATLFVNVIGSLVMGILYVIIIERVAMSSEMRSLLMVGFLGAFTTFSTFSLDTLRLWQNGDNLISLIYVIATITLCLVGVSVGVWLTRLI
ncbi:MAG: fluoride efflux transporter CrcB [Porticoccaceae bacterium]|nr:fluoride efflux transporter CrcB [Porticoccaceae bacterium]MDG1473933.1 fluoride efflux transporter CrcB [Porticoccaceae bacterium]